MAAGALLYLGFFLNFQLEHPVILLLLSIFAAVTHTLKVEGATARSSYQISWIAYGASFVLLTPAETMVVLVAAHVAEWFWHRSLWYIALFNLTAFGIIAAIATLLWQTISAGSAPFTPISAGAFLAAAALFTVMNHLMVGLVIWLARGENLMRSGVFNTLTLMIDFVSFGMGIATGLVWLVNPYAVIFILSPLYLIYTTLQVPSLQHQTRLEPKTGLYNARFFADTLSTELERADKFNRPLTVVMADVDLLRNINNNYGHLAGDTVLIGIANTLREFVRDYDIVARFGGEEYAILMPETTLQQALPLIEQLRHKVATTAYEVSTSVTPLTVTMSFGVAEREIYGQTGEQIVHNADLSVYRAKSTTRNRVCYYEDGEIKDYSKGEPPVAPKAEEDTKHTLDAIPQLIPPLKRRHLFNNTQEAHSIQNPEAAEKAVLPNAGQHRAALDNMGAAVAPEKPLTVIPKPDWMATLYVALLAAITVGVTLWSLTFSITIDWIGIIVFAALILLTEWLAIDIYTRNTSVSTSVAPLIAGACLLGAPGALILSLVLSAAAMIKHRSPLIRFIFNTSNHLLAGLICVNFLYWTDLMVTAQTSMLSALGVITATILTYISTTLLMTGVIYLTSGLPIREIWSERFYWLWPYYIALGLVAYALAIGYLNSGLLGVTIFFVPLLMLRISQNQYLRRTESMVLQLRAANNELISRSNEISAMNEGLILALSHASDLRDPYVHGHAQHVARYAVLIAKEVGLHEAQLEAIQQAALLHDIGKIGIPETILFKPARLTSEEYTLMKQHAALGAALVQEIESLQHLAPFIRYHHEYYNGGGYPEGRSSTQIPLEARILGVADAIEAMASDRPYRRALTASAILQELQTHSGTQFDPEIVDAFTKVIKAQGETLIVNSARTISRIIEQQDNQRADAAPEIRAGERMEQSVMANPISNLDTMNIALQRAIAAHRRMEVSAQEGRDLAETLLKVASTINMTLDHNRVLTVILEQLALVMDYENASIMLLEGDMLNSVARRSIHVPESQSLSVPVHKLHHIQEVIEGQRAVVISDTADDPRWMRRAGSEAVRCWLGIPLMVQNRMIGLMNLSNGVPGYYTERHVQVATAFAAQAAIAIENAHLFSQVQSELAERERAEEALRQSQEHLQERVIELQIAKAAEEQQRELAETLSEAAHSLNSSLSLQEVLSTILTYLGRVVSSDSIAVKLLSGERTDLLAHRRSESQDWQFTKRSFGLLPLEAQVVEKQLPVIVDNVAMEPLWQPITGAEKVVSWLGVPLMVQDQVVGLLTLTKHEARFYNDSAARLVAAFANQAAIAITNARLYEQVQAELIERMRAEKELQDERELLAQRVEERTKELKEANAQLTSALRTKDEFLATMSHELRTPLNAILLLSESMQNGVYGAIEERQVGVLDNVKQSARHLLSLINDILDMSKIEAGMFEIDKGPVSVSAICRNSLTIIEESARSKGLELVYHMDPAIDTVNGDERRLAQILVNLLSNAVKFTPEGGKVGLEVTGDTRTGMLHFAVWDTGIGIAEADQKRLFQPFVQLDSKLSRLYEGTGLGLALVDRLAKLHGGSVALQSEPGQGSRFTVSIPWEEEEDDFMALALQLLGGDRKHESPQFEHHRDHPQTEPLEPVLSAVANGYASNGAHSNGAHENGAHKNGQHNGGYHNGAHSNGVHDHPNHRNDYQDEAASTHAGTPNTGTVAATPLPERAQPVILLVEDNEIGVEAMRDYLSANDYQVIIAQNGAEAIAKTQEFQPDLILMDVQMPDMDGLEATNLIRQNPQHATVPIIALTALAMPGDRERCLQAGVNEYLSKPVSMKHLLQVMAVQLRQPQLQYSQ
jgi:diguanylate cyclase (GGDEF)-like protein/putative nucleotidyltransferase with HDIG domain